jgi:thiamine monophosphate kinase
MNRDSKQPEPKTVKRTDALPSLDEETLAAICGGAADLNKLVEVSLIGSDIVVVPN